MTKRFQRFIESTLPNIIGFGMVTVALTSLFGLLWGVISVVVFAIVDIIWVEQ